MLHCGKGRVSTILLVAVLWSCGSDSSGTDIDASSVDARPVDAAVVDAPVDANVEPPPHNVLIIIADDVGVEKIGVYEEHVNAGPTPNIDALAAEGVLFRNAWSSPTCSPTRATILSGRYGFETLIGRWIPQAQVSQWGLQRTETLLPELLDNYDNAAVGKWHLAGTDASANKDYRHPVESGFNTFKGSMGNLGQGGGSYISWAETTVQPGVGGLLVTNGTSTTYGTQNTVDDAIVRLGQLTEPFFLYVAFNAPHAPMHVPPASYNLTTTFVDADNPTFPEMHRAMTEAVDIEMGRLLAHLGTLPAGERTTIIFLGDNGTQTSSVEAPIVASHAKGSVYEGGINVPFIIRSPLVPAGARGGESQALVSTRDIFATVAEIAGKTPALAAGESVSLVPYLEDPSVPSQRASVYSESFSPNGPGPYDYYHQAAREARYKLIRRDCAAEEFYDLSVDPYETSSLLVGALDPAQTNAYNALAAELDSKDALCP
jgi:arylsulfatase A-like enzyme